MITPKIKNANPVLITQINNLIYRNALRSQQQLVNIWKQLLIMPRADQVNITFYRVSTMI